MAQGIAGAVLIALSCLAADRYAATLTGDPLALIVLIHTAIALDGDSVQRRRVWRPRTEERVAALEALMRQPGPKAPWSTAPVPAIAPVLLGPLLAHDPAGECGAVVAQPPPPLRLSAPIRPLHYDHKGSALRMHLWQRRPIR